MKGIEHCTILSVSSDFFGTSFVKEGDKRSVYGFFYMKCSVSVRFGSGNKLGH